MAEGAGEKESGRPRLPEIHLKWSDFVWSLEKLRNKPYNKTTRERDWFRVNPLEMILLGTQSLSCSEPVKKDHGTMMLVMASLKEEMVQRPRYWLRLLEVLTVTAQREDTPSQIVQRCNDALKTVWEVLEGTPEFSPNVFAFAISQLKIIEVVERTQNESLLNPEMLEFVKELKLLVSSSSVGCSLPETESDSNVIECMMRHVYSSGREAACLEELTIQVYCIVKCSRGKTYPACFHQSQPSFERLVCAIRECSATSDRSLTLLIGIIQLLAVRCDQFDNQSSKYPPATPTPMNEGEGGANEGEGEGVNEGEGGGVKETSTDDEKVLSPISKVVELFDVLTSAIAQWRELVPAQQTDHSDVVEKFLCLAHVILARNSLSDSLPETISFFRDPFRLLITYSTEGYLTDSPSEFLTELLEFVTALVEHGTPPLHALQTNLPNLFGPAFGVRHHLVSCKLLEYGYLAVCSQHRKSLLTEGLRFLTGVFHLFPPLDETRARERARNLRLEAMEVSGIILDNLIHSLPIEGAYRKGGRGESPGQVTTAPGQVMTRGSLTYPEVRDLHVPLTAGGELTVSQEEREDDRRSRILIFIGLLKLACAMIRNGENISFLFASCLPKLFTKSSRDETIPYNKDKLLKFFGEEPPPPSGGIPWNVDLKKLAIQILELGTLCLENNSTSPFQLCGIVVPKLIKNLEKMDSFSEEEKFSFMLDILHITQKRVEGGRGIDHFLSYGIDLLSLLTPFSASIDRMREFMDQMDNHFVIYNQGSLLYLIKRACEFMMDTYKDDTPEIQDLFRTLLFKGKRDEIRFVFKICNKQLAGEHYVPLRQYLYGYASGKLNRRQLVALCELIVASMDIEKPRKVIREVVSNVEEEEEVVVKEREAMEIAVVTKLISPCLKQVEDALELSRFKRDVWEDVSMQLSRIALFRTLFQSEFYTFSHYTNEEMLAVFQCKFPHDVLCDEDTMELLSISATRIEHVQTPRYDSLKLLLSGILRYFLTLQVETSDDENVQAVLIERQRLLQVYIDDFPRNREDKERLISSGYSSNLWNRRVSVLVKTDGTLSLEENMRQNLLACYSEFADILKQMAITHVSVDGEMIKVVNLFTDDLSFADLKGRRAIAVRMIDQRRMEGSLEGHFYERKAALLAKEDDIEAEFEKMSNVPIKPKTFTSSLSIGFLDCARCCGTRIIGCYAPTGEHCERPLEIGIRCDSAIASIYDEGGQEIENAELLLTEEGAFLFKAYTNGHPYDTSQVWLQLFTALLKEEEEEGEENEGLPSSLIPALVVPKGYPNQRTWEAMRRRQGTELTGSILTCRPDFSPEWRTYYDHRPERVRVGVDMILHCGFTMNADQSHPVLQRQRSRFTKDLAGLIFEELMQELLADDWLSQFKFLGKVLSQYIGACITNGEGDKNLLVTG